MIKIINEMEILMHPLEKRGGGSPAAEYFSFALPAIIGMILTAGIVVVDGIFIGRAIGSAGLASVNLTLPVFHVFLGITIMVSVGGAVKSSRLLGQKKAGEAGSVFAGTLVLSVLSTVVLLILLVIFFEPVMGLIRAGGELYDLCRSYFSVIRWFYPVMMLNISLSVFVRTAGRPELSLVFGLMGNVLNIILDYLLIMRFNMGLSGAAAASGVSVTIPLLCSVLFFKSGKSSLSFGKLRLSGRLVAGIFANGSSEMIGQLSVTISVWLFNAIVLKRLGVDGLAAYTIVSYFIMLQGMVLTGLATGLGPVCGYHFGAGHHERLVKILKTALAAGFAAGILGWLIVILCGRPAAAFFSGGNAEVVRIAAGSYTVFTAAFLINGFNLLTSGFLTSLGRARASFVVAALRGLVLNTAALLIFPVLFGDQGIWWTFPVAEALTFLAALPMLAAALRSLTCGIPGTASARS